MRHPHFELPDLPMQFTVHCPACGGPWKSAVYSTVTLRFIAASLKRGRNAAWGCAGDRGFGRVGIVGGGCFGALTVAHGIGGNGGGGCDPKNMGDV